MPALTPSLSAGVLRVWGTDAAERITVKQVNGQISARQGGPLSVAVWLSTGAGLPPYQSWGPGFGGTDGYATGTADFNGDGKADFWQADVAGNGTRGAFVWLSTGTGLQPYRERGTGFGGNQYLTVTADFNADGKADFLQLARAGSGTIAVWLSAGTTLRPWTSWGTGRGADVWATQVADIDGDRRADLWQVSRDGSSGVADIRFSLGTVFTGNADVLDGGSGNNLLG